MSSNPFLVAVLAFCTGWSCAFVRGQERLSLHGDWRIERVEPRAGTGATYISLPAANETALGVAFDGSVKLSRTLDLPSTWKGRKIWAEFLAVATHARVTCNDAEVGSHLGGWTPFCCELTAALRWDGEDSIAIEIDERVGHNTQGFLPIIQPHFGGVWQGVSLRVDDGVAIDRAGTSLFGRLERDGSGALLSRVALRWSAGTHSPEQLQLRLTVRTGDDVVARTTERIKGAGALEFQIAIAGVRAWSPAEPFQYVAHLSLWDGDREIDSASLRVGFRRLEAHGREIHWNGALLSVRGVLHWGCGSGLLHPPTDPAWWRSQIELWKSLGFNLLKCCLFVPPRCVFELCDELGMLIWQEYPTWHPKLDAAHKDELLREYREFFAHDRGHACVAFRSITCETGHDADLGVVRALFDACHADVPDTLVVDDSSWIGWQRVTDFWDEHPYGNCRWFRSRLGDFERHMEQHGDKPLLLGECMAGDTWVDLAAWGKRGDWPAWRRPLCLDSQREFELWVAAQFGESTLAAMPAIARNHAMALRRAQIETLRARLPYAGYVVSVAADFPKARMGLCDEDGVPKWSVSDFSWHGDRMLTLDGLSRAFVTAPDRHLRLRVCPVGFGPDATAFESRPMPAVDRPTRAHAEASLDGIETGWDVWLLPQVTEGAPSEVLVLDVLDDAALTAIEKGASAFLRVGNLKGTIQAHPLWHLRGAPFAPPHPVHAALPAQMLCELLPFDLDGDRMIPYAPWRDQVDPILAYWETHDLPEVRMHLLAFETRLGKGRLIASTLDHATDAGRYVEHELLRHLAEGPPPRRALRPETIAAWRSLCTERVLELSKWRFATDPDDRGLDSGWQLPAHDDQAAGWRELAAGMHWENQAEDLRGYTGIAWYRTSIDVPVEFAGLTSRMLFAGVDDSFALWIDGKLVDRRGDPATGVTVWLEPQTIELGATLSPGRHDIAVRVVDHAGSGGLWRPVSVTTGPTGILRDLRR